MITLSNLKWQKNFPFADGKIFAISNGKSVSYDRKNLFSMGIKSKTLLDTNLDQKKS